MKLKDEELLCYGIESQEFINLILKFWWYWNCFCVPLPPAGRVKSNYKVESASNDIYCHPAPLSGIMGRATLHQHCQLDSATLCCFLSAASWKFSAFTQQVLINSSSEDRLYTFSACRPWLGEGEATMTRETPLSSPHTTQCLCALIVARHRPPQRYSEKTNFQMTRVFNKIFNFILWQDLLLIIALISVCLSCDK